MRRIFFDTNEGNHALGYWLHLPKSCLDLAAMGDELQEDVRVIILMPDELEMEAILKFDAHYQHWTAIPVPGTIRYLDGSD